MKSHYKLLAIAVMASMSSTAIYAANYSVEARSDAMGGVGVVAGTYLTAPFFNPALAAIYRRQDDLGVLIPSVGFNYNDPSKLKDAAKDISDLIDENKYTDANDKLVDIDGANLDFDLGGAAAVGIPNRYMSMTLYTKMYTKSFVTPEIGLDKTTLLPDVDTSYIKSVSVGIAEAGVSLAKYTNFLHQHISLGITPKLQRIYTYSYAGSFDDFKPKDLRDNQTSENMFNLDAGALWFYGPFRLGFTAKNLIGRDVKTRSFTYNNNGTQVPISSYAFSMRPVYTVGGGIVANYFSLTADYDLNEEKGFTGFDDNRQMLRGGIEVDLMHQLQLRGGYMKDMAHKDRKGTYTAGIGISPWNVLHLDLSAQYTDKNAMGCSANFVMTY